MGMEYLARRADLVGSSRQGWESLPVGSGAGAGRRVAAVDVEETDRQ